ncbi:MAG: hypothetical protein L7U87_02370 [Chlamydiales bacterium]|nr:hypothetical protein [Chlamydiales bacterium]
MRRVVLLLILTFFLLLSACSSTETIVSDNNFYKDLIGQEFVCKKNLYISLEKEDKQLWLVSKSELESSQGRYYKPIYKLSVGDKFKVTRIESSQHFLKGEFIHMYGEVSSKNFDRYFYLGHIINQYIRPEKMYDRSFFVENNFVKPLKE